MKTLTRGLVTGLLWVLCAANAQNQNKLSGTVTSESGQGLGGVSVRVLNTPLGIVTDAEGSFEITLAAGTYHLQISCLGFAQQVITLTTDQQRTEPIVLKPSATALDEVVISAQRTEESLSQAIVAISALGPARLQETRTWQLADLPGLVPNYYYQQLGVSFQQIQSIRGIQVFSENAAVATYIDGVNNLDILANGFPLVDVERVEVLRGPQGTLFGRNALGGVINITTQRPTNESKGFAEISLGNLGLRRYSAAYRAPLVPNKLFVGATGLFERAEGYLTNDTSGTVNPQLGADGQRVGDQTTVYGNLFVTWLLGNAFSLTANAKAQVDYSDNSSFYTSVISETQARATPDNIYLSRIARHRRDLFNSSLSATYQTQQLRISSVTTYQRIALSFADLDFGGGSIFWSLGSDGSIGGQSLPQQVITQDFKLSSANPQAQLSYTLGLFGFWQNSFEPTTNTVNESPFFPGLLLTATNEGRNLGLAAYGQLSYRITDPLAVTVGLRYDRETRESRVGANTLPEGLLGPATQATYEGDYSAFSPKLAAMYDFSEALRGYLSYTRGYRPGGVNTQVLPPDVSQTFDPEYSDNLEVGLKFFPTNSRFNISFTGFYINWTQLQFFNLVAPGVFARSNVGDAASWGFEMEGNWIPVKNIQLETAVGYNNTEYKDFVYRDFFGGETQISGNSLSNAPEYTAYLGSQYSLPLNKNWRWITRGELRLFGDQFTDIQNTLKQDAYALINVRVGFQSTVFDVFFWARNLTDERVIVYGSPETSFSRSTVIGPPTTYGFTFTTRF